MARANERGRLIFRKMERDVVNLSSDAQPDHVHSFRTTARRLQILLKLLVPEQGRSHKKLLKILNRIRKRAGKLRDLDVQLAALRSLKVPMQPRRKTQLVQEMLELRARHEKSLSKLLSKSEVRSLRKRLKRAAKTAHFEGLADPLTAARRILTSTASSKPVDEDVLHRYRLAVKRARYAAEFAPKSAATTQFIGQLKRLQDSIGNWHDWLTLTNTASQRFGEVNQSPLVAALHNVTGGKFRNAVAELSASPLLKSEPKPAMARKEAQKGESKISAQPASAA